MSEQGTPARDSDDDKEHDTSGDVSEQNGEEQPDGAEPDGGSDTSDA